MKVFIASSANLTIDEKYVNIASQVAELFAKASSKKYTGKMNKAYLNSIMRREFNGEIELEETNKKAAKGA